MGTPTIVWSSILQGNNCQAARARIRTQTVLAGNVDLTITTRTALNKIIVNFLQHGQVNSNCAIDVKTQLILVPLTQFALHQILLNLIREKEVSPHPATRG